MVVPVTQLPADRLAGIRPAARPEARPGERDAERSEGSATPAGGAFDTLARTAPDRAAAIRLGDHTGQRRPAGRDQVERDRTTDRQSQNQTRAALTKFESHRARVADHLARLDGRYANLAFQAQIIAQENPARAAGSNAPPESSAARKVPSHRAAQAVSAAYRRHDSQPDLAPLIEPHRPLNLIL